MEGLAPVKAVHVMENGDALLVFPEATRLSMEHFLWPIAPTKNMHVPALRHFREEFGVGSCTIHHRAGEPLNCGFMNRVRHETPEDEITWLELLFVKMPDRKRLDVFLAFLNGWMASKGLEPVEMKVVDSGILWALPLKVLRMQELLILFRILQSTVKGPREACWLWIGDIPDHEHGQSFRGRPDQYAWG